MKAFLLSFLVVLGWQPVLLAAHDNHRRDHHRHHHHHKPSFSITIGGGGHWVPGHYATRLETIVVEPSRLEKVWVPPVLEKRVDEQGREYHVEVSPGYHRYVRVPARVDVREVAVWVPGYYSGRDPAPCHSLFWFRF